MAIFPLAPDQTIAQMWSNGARGGFGPIRNVQHLTVLNFRSIYFYFIIRVHIFNINSSLHRDPL